MPIGRPKKARRQADILLQPVGKVRNVHRTPVPATVWPESGCDRSRDPECPADQTPERRSGGSLVGSNWGQRNVCQCHCRSAPLAAQAASLLKMRTAAETDQDGIPMRCAASAKVGFWVRKVSGAGAAIAGEVLLRASPAHSKMAAHPYSIEGLARFIHDALLSFRGVVFSGGGLDKTACDDSPVRF